MSPKKVEKEESEETLAVKETAVEAKAPVAVEPVVEVKKITFKQFVAGKSHIKPHHLAGLKAFIGNVDKVRTPEEWERLIKDY